MSEDKLKKAESKIADACWNTSVAATSRFEARRAYEWKINLAIWTPLAAAATEMEAEIICTRLRAEGVEAYSPGRHGGHAPAVVYQEPYPVLVLADDAERARRILGAES